MINIFEKLLYNLSFNNISIILIIEKEKKNATILNLYNNLNLYVPWNKGVHLFFEILLHMFKLVNRLWYI